MGYHSLFFYENRAEMTPRPCIKSRFGENSKHHGLLPNSQISNFCKQLHVRYCYCVVPYFLYFEGIVAHAGGNWLYRRVFVWGVLIERSNIHNNKHISRAFHSTSELGRSPDARIPEALTMLNSISQEGNLMS